MNQTVSLTETKDTLLASITKLNGAFASGRLDGYKALALKDSHTEKTTVNLQWGPMMRS